jgi:hypothetical protein
VSNALDNRVMGNFKLEDHNEGQVRLFFSMRRGHPTRYFVFTRVNPTDNDVEVLSKGCASVKADFYGYTIRNVNAGTKTIMKGFLVLSRDSTFENRLAPWFPNFLLTAMPASMDANFDDLPPEIIVHGKHPYHECKRNLFGDDFHQFLLT